MLGCDQLSDLCVKRNKIHKRSIAGEKVFSARGACSYLFHPDSKNYEICHPLTKNSYKAC